MKKPLDPFVAGWESAMEYRDHEWGPSPPNNPQAAKRIWENTCDSGHTVRVTGCKACKRFGTALREGSGRRRAI